MKLSHHYLVRAIDLLRWVWLQGWQLFVAMVTPILYNNSYSLNGQISNMKVIEKSSNFDC